MTSTAAARNASDPSAAVRPHVTLHFAQSLDGRIATRSGASRWISGTDATRFAHVLRAESGAVIVGSQTALRDDPLLTVRHAAGPNPIRVVLDGRGRLPAHARVFEDASAPTIVATNLVAAAESPLPAHAERWSVPRGASGEGVDLGAVLERLAGRGVDRVLVEGGGRILTAFLRAGFVDRMVVAIAPMVLGSGVDAVGDLAVDRMEEALGFTTERVWRLGEDVLVALVPKRDPRA